MQTASLSINLPLRQDAAEATETELLFGNNFVWRAQLSSEATTVGTAEISRADVAAAAANVGCRCLAPAFHEYKYC